MNYMELMIKRVNDIGLNLEDICKRGEDYIKAIRDDKIDDYTISIEESEKYYS